MAVQNLHYFLPAGVYEKLENKNGEEKIRLSSRLTLKTACTAKPVIFKILFRTLIRRYPKKVMRRTILT